jgi:hypothetical protein
MIELRDKESGDVLGKLTEGQLQFLIDHLEEESETDQDYYLNQYTIEMLEEQGADPQLISLLRKGMGEREEMEIFWSRK